MQRIFLELVAIGTTSVYYKYNRHHSLLENCWRCLGIKSEEKLLLKNLTLTDADHPNVLFECLNSYLTLLFPVSVCTPWAHSACKPHHSKPCSFHVDLTCLAARYCKKKIIIIWSAYVRETTEKFSCMLCVVRIHLSRIPLIIHFFCQFGSPNGSVWEQQNNWKRGSCRA